MRTALTRAPGGARHLCRHGGGPGAARGTPRGAAAGPRGCWSELARDGLSCEQAALRGEAAPGVPFIYQQLSKSQGPIIAATDYVRAVPETVRAYTPSSRRYMTLGTDGFGRSDTRAALRAFFGVDAQTIVRAAKHALT